MVAHKILVTSPEAKFLFPFLGPGLWTGTLPRACPLSERITLSCFILDKRQREQAVCLGDIIGEVTLTQKQIFDKTLSGVNNEYKENLS